MNFHIDSLTNDHLESCIAVFIAAFTIPSHYVWHPDDVRIRLTDLWNAPKRIGLVAIDDPDSSLAGFAVGDLVQVSDGPALRVDELCVHPSRQGYGLGSRLLIGMEELAREHGAHSAYLSVQPNSVDFCHRLGYRPQMEWISMARRLQESPASENR